MAVWGIFAALLLSQLGDGHASSLDYETITMEDTCDILPRSIVIAASGRGSALLITSHQSDAYKSGLTCTLTVKTKSGYRLIVVFEKLAFPNCSDTLLISNVQNDPGPICKSLPEPLKSASNVINVTFSTGGAPKSADQGFSAVVTSFKDGSYCSMGQHKCTADIKCIADNFVCDGHNNCGDKSDEVCDTSSPWSRNLGPLVFILPVMVLMALCVATPLVIRSCSKQPPEETVRAANEAGAWRYRKDGPDEVENLSRNSSVQDLEQYCRHPSHAEPQLASKTYRFIHLPPGGHDPSARGEEAPHVYMLERVRERPLSACQPSDNDSMKRIECYESRTDEHDDDSQFGIREVSCYLERSPYPVVGSLESHSKIIEKCVVPVHKRIRASNKSPSNRSTPDKALIKNDC